MPTTCFDNCPCLKDRTAITKSTDNREFRIVHEFYCGVLKVVVKDTEEGRLKDCPLFEFRAWEDT